MRFNLKAFVVFVAACLLMAVAVSSGGGWVHAAEAATSVLILLSVVGFLRGRQRTG